MPHLPLNPTDELRVAIVARTDAKSRSVVLLDEDGEESSS
jgi:uncharacterized RmlC-like cupin family protein